MVSRAAGQDAVGLTVPFWAATTLIVVHHTLTPLDCPAKPYLKCLESSEEERRDVTVRRSPSPPPRARRGLAVKGTWDYGGWGWVVAPPAPREGLVWTLTWEQSTGADQEMVPCPEGQRIRGVAGG